MLVGFPVQVRPFLMYFSDIYKKTEKTHKTKKVR